MPRTFLVLLVLSLYFAPPAALFAVPQNPSLEDPALPIQPKNPRSEDEEFRVKAAALYAHGRMLMQREEFEGALKRMERAARYDPQAVSILDEIVPLAFELKRNAEAARYAVLAAERNPKDAVLLRRPAMYLSDQQDWERALTLYEKAVELQKNPTGDVSTPLLQMEMGRLYFLTEQNEKAAASFAIVAEALEHPEKYGLNEALVKSIEGEKLRTYTLLAEGFLAGGKLEDAVKWFRKADKEEPNEGRLSYQLARVEHEAGKTNAALEKLQVYLNAKLSTAGVGPYELLAKLLKKKKGNELAAERALLEELAKLQEADPSNASLSYFYADQLLKAKKYDEAAKVFEEVLSLEPALEGYEGLVAIYTEKNDSEKLLAVLGSAIGRAGSLDPLEAAIDPLLEKKEVVTALLDHAIAKLEKDELKPENAFAAASLAIQAEAFDQAEKLFEKALSAESPGKPQVMIAWGLEMLMADQAERSAKVFRRAIEEKVLPDNEAALHFYLAGALAMAEKSQEALKAAEKAAEMEPDNIRFSTRPAWILYRDKQYDKAEAMYLEVVEELDDQHDSEEIREVVRDARLILSNICVVLGRKPEAEEWLEQVLDEFPEDVGAHNDLGYLWAEQGKNLQRALKMTQYAVAGDSENAAYRDSLGWAYYQLGQYEKAVEELQKAADMLEEPDGVVFDHLGDALHKFDRQEEAKKAWQTAAEAFEKAEEPEQAEAARKKIEQP